MCVVGKKKTIIFVNVAPISILIYRYTMYLCKRRAKTIKKINISQTLDMMKTRTET